MQNRSSSKLPGISGNMNILENKLDQLSEKEVALNDTVQLMSDNIKEHSSKLPTISAIKDLMIESSEAMMKKILHTFYSLQEKMSSIHKSTDNSSKSTEETKQDTKKSYPETESVCQAESAKQQSVKRKARNCKSVEKKKEIEIGLPERRTLI